MNREQARLRTIAAMEMEALGPQRLAKMRTADRKSKGPYIEGATLRLKDIDNLAKQGHMTSEEVQKVQGWRCKSCYLLEKTSAQGRLAAAETGNVAANLPGPSSAASQEKPSASRRFRKAQLPIAPRPSQGLSSQIAGLSKENADLRALRDFADEKVKALTIFGAHQDDALYLLSHKLADLRLTHEDDREQIEEEVNAILRKADDAVDTLRSQFPSLEEVVSRHDDIKNYSTSAPLREWLKQNDHIQKEHEEHLRSLAEDAK